MNSLTSAVVLSFLASGSALGEPNGPMKEEVREVGPFHRIEVGQGIEADVTQAAKTSVVVRAEDAVLAHVKTDVENGTLVIHMAEHEHGMHSHRGVTVTVTAPSLDGASATSGAHLKLASLSGSELAVRASGGAEVEGAGMKEGQMKVEASAGSQVRLAGETQGLELECSSGSSVKGGELSAEKVQVSASAGASAEVRASASVRGNLSAGAELEVRGAPPVRELSTSSGASYHFQGAREL